jgi:general secretion pathway protein K
VRRRDERGVVLIVVLFFALLLTGSVATFLRQAVVDAMISRNREARARADSLARGGVELARALLLADKALEVEAGAPFDSGSDLWARIGERPIEMEGGGTLRLHIEDAGARLNLNAVLRFDETGNPTPDVEPFLQQLFEKVIDEMPVPPGEKVYDIAELVAHLIDWVDADDVGRLGAEDDYYQQQDPPYRAHNGPLRSVEQLRLVEGFDAKLVKALAPYVTVYPFVGPDGINPNTAPPHVLKLLFVNDGTSKRLASDDLVRQILEVREEGGTLCGENAATENCTPLVELVTNANSIYPPPSFASDVFTVVSEAQVGEVRRSIEAVLDRRPAPDVLRLSWWVL